MYFTMICAEIRFRWKYVATRVAYFDRFRGMDTSGLTAFVEFRCILFLDTSESGVLVESRCIWNIWFLEHTSGMHDLGPVRCIIELVSVGDTSGLRIRFPSRCTEVQILIKYTSGWANIGYFRCIASNRKNKIHRNSTIHTNPDVSKSNIHRKSKFSSNPDVSQIISRDATYTPSQYIPAQAGITLIPAIFLPYLWVGAVLHGV